MAYGNTSVSSLLRAAKAAQQKQYSLEDSIAAYEYDLSPKTQADFEKYQAHLGNRIKQYQGVDPLKALNYQKTITSANRSFTSSELSRATTQVLYGNMDNGTKLNTMMALYQRAVENGDENLAQRIEGQAAMLQQTMQRFGGGGYGRGGAEYDAELKGIKDAGDSLKRQAKLLESEFRRGNITLQQLRGGYTDRTTGEKMLGLHDIYQSLDSTRKQLEGMPATDEREKYYASLNDTLKSSMAQNLTDKAGRFSQAGEDVYAKKWNPLTRSFEIERQKVDGYEMTDIGAMLKPETNSKDFINYKSGSGGFDRDKGQDDTALFPKNASNKLGENIYALPIPELGGRAEWIVKQNPETGGYEFLGTKDQLRADPTLQADVGIASQANNPLVQAANALGLKNNLKAAFTDVNMEAMKNPALAKAIQDQDVIGSTLEYGKTKAGKLFQKTAANKMLKDIGGAMGQLGQNWQSNMSKYGGLLSLNPMSQMAAYKNVLADLGKQVEAKKARDAENARAEAARMAQAAQEAIARTQQRNRPAPVAPFVAPRAPIGDTARQINMGFTEDEFSRKGIGTNSLYRL